MTLTNDFFNNWLADDKFTALFEENEYKWYVEKVLSWMDIHEFLKLLKAQTNKSIQTRYAEGKK